MFSRVSQLHLLALCLDRILKKIKSLSIIISTAWQMKRCPSPDCILLAVTVMKLLQLAAPKCGKAMIGGDREVANGKRNEAHTHTHTHSMLGTFAR